MEAADSTKNEEVQMAVRECLRMQEPDFHQGGTLTDQCQAGIYALMCSGNTMIKNETSVK
jgi:hypothetical protein